MKVAVRSVSPAWLPAQGERAMGGDGRLRRPVPDEEHVVYGHPLCVIHDTMCRRAATRLSGEGTAGGSEHDSKGIRCPQTLTARIW